MLEKESAQGSIAMKWHQQDLDSDKPTAAFMSVLGTNYKPRHSLETVTPNKEIESQPSSLSVVLSMGQTSI